MIRTRRLVGPVSVPLIAAVPLYTVPAGFHDLIRCILIVNNNLGQGEVLLGVDGIVAISRFARQTVNGSSFTRLPLEIDLGPGDELWAQLNDNTSLVLTATGTRYPV